MSFINKVKNFFYEDVEEDDDEFEMKEALKREEKEKRKIELEKKKLIHIEELNKDLSERELFKSEKTFNFPMDLDDDEFAKTMNISEEKEESRSSVKEEKNMYARRNRYTTPQSRNKHKEITSTPEEPKKFHPSPIVSPIYGILDKNYTVEDVVDKNLSKTKEFSLEKKIVDFDSVRNKAYKELDAEIEKTLNLNKNIFYNLDEEEIKEENSGSISDFIEEPYDKNENEEDDVIITYEGENEYNKATLEDTKETEMENEEDLVTPDVEIPKPEKKTRKSKKQKEEEKKEEYDEKEDLFNLIDNMYNDEEDEEEDD